MIRITITTKDKDNPEAKIEVEMSNSFKTGCVMIAALGMAAGDIIEQISKIFQEGKLREGASSILTASLLEGLRTHDDLEDEECKKES